jgi:hypothetical protein
MLRASESVVPDRGDRVRINGCVIGVARKHVGHYGTVERFYIGHYYSVGVALDGEDGVFAFKPEELEVIPDLMKNLHDSRGVAVVPCHAV